MSDQELAAFVIATSFAAGLNVAAPVATLGLLARAGAIVLPRSLDPLASWWVIGGSLVLFTIEFFADKMPVFDLFWNALQTFIRVPVGAILAFAATAQLSLQAQLAATLLGGLIAFLAHGGKSAARAVVTPSPEPFSNMALSVGEDVLAVSITWLAARHPLWAGGIALVLLASIVVVARRVAKSIARAVKSTRRVT